MSHSPQTTTPAVRLITPTSTGVAFALVLAMGAPGVLAEPATPAVEPNVATPAPPGPELESLRAELDAAGQALAGARAEAEARIRELAEARGALAAAEAELRTQKEAASTAAKARSDLDAQLSAAQRELGAARASLEQAQATAQARADAAAAADKGRADLETQLKAVREEVAAARSGTEKAQADASARAAALATAEQARAELETRLGAELARFGAAEKAANEKLAAAEQAAADRVAAAQREAKAVADKLDAAERQAAEARERLEQSLIAEKKTQVAMAAELETLKARLPVSAGGSLTADQARAGAAKAGEVFLAATERARKQRTDEAKTALQAAAAALQQAQFEVAVATDAQGVYRLRAEDTLGVVAGRFYGSGKRWPIIHEANRHVLADPDAVVPGTTLVVP